MVIAIAIPSTRSETLSYVLDAIYSLFNALIILFFLVYPIIRSASKKKKKKEKKNSVQPSVKEKQLHRDSALDSDSDSELSLPSALLNSEHSTDLDQSQSACSSNEDPTPFSVGSSCETYGVWILSI